MDFDFILAGSEKWGSGNQTSKHHLVRQFLNLGYRVLYIENISMRRIGSNGVQDISKAWKIVRSFFGGGRSPLPGLVCVTPIYLPLPKSRLAGWLNKKLISGLVRYYARKMALHNPIYLYFMPTGVNLQGTLNENLSVYYITDNYAGFGDVEQEEMRRLEAKALKSADLVFATASTLVASRSQIRSPIHLSPHGVDSQHFASTRSEHIQVPEEVTQIPSPRLGFMGSLLPDSVDLELIKRLSVRHPDWHFVLFGLQFCDLSALLALPNVHFLGAKPYSELPAYLKGLDVALIPFRVNELTHDLNPIKLREYLAAGLPIVATDLPSIREFSEHVACVRTEEEWERAIEQALREPGDSESRQAAVAQESWEARALAVIEVIKRKLGET